MKVVACASLRFTSVRVTRLFRFPSLKLQVICPRNISPILSTAKIISSVRGIFFKTAEALELTGRARTVAFDKTGTLTCGEPEVIDVLPLGETSEAELIRIAASLEYSSEHPLARAVVKRAEGQKLDTVYAFEAKTGFGVVGNIDGERVVGGNLKLLGEELEATEHLKKEYERLSSEGKTPMIFAKGASLLGIIAVRDAVKEDSRDAVAALLKMGLRVVMLTGDNERTAKAIASEVGIDCVYAGVLPEEKGRILAELSRDGRAIMVGDGINDAPALARADVGMAIGGGTDIAIDSADVVLAGNSLFGVAVAISLSRATLVNIKQNLFWAFIYNMIGIPLAAGAFIPLLAFEMSPMLGAAAMSISSFSVVMNALRLNLFKYNENKTIKNEVRKMTKVMKIEGMMCPHCEARVKSILESLPAVESAEVSHKSGEAVVTLASEIESSVLEDAVTAGGYKVTGIA